VTIRVLLVDDQDLVRAGFAMVLGSQPDLTVAGEAADGAAAIRLAREVPADVMVMDVRMPGLDGVAATREICQAAERPRVLILTTFDLDEYAFAALRAGASGFLLKSAPPEEFLYAIRSIHEGDSVVAPSTTRRLIGRFMPHLPDSGPAADREDLAELTAREREVLTEVGSGLSNTEIAARLHISEATVKTHVGHIMAKLGLRDRIQVVVYAYETGLIAPQGRRLGRRQSEVPAMCRLDVDQAVRGHHQVVPELRVQRLVQAQLVERLAHVAQPGVPLGLADCEPGMAHPQPGMPAQLVVGARPAPVLHEEQPQVLLGRAEIFGRVHRPQRGIVRNALVEPVDQAAERLLPAHGLIEAGRLAHVCQLTGQARPDRPAVETPGPRAAP
jgi:DNA-binding NarL/FixJ family response regulator